MAESLMQAARVGHTVKDAVVFMRQPQVKLLHAKRARIVTIALEEIRTLVGRLANAASTREFVTMRDEVFPDYANLSLIISNTFSIHDERPKRARAINESIKATVNFFGKSESILGAVLVREAVFCLDTLRRTYRLANEINKGNDLPEDRVSEDRKLCAQYTQSVLYAQLHLDCLQYAVTKRIKLDPEILHELLAGARSSVMAYSYARQAIQIRTKPESYQFEPIHLDEEDNELLEESYSDYLKSESAIDGNS